MEKARAAAIALHGGQDGAEQRHRFLYAFSMVENAPCNAICRKVGFTLLGGIVFPARQGGFLRCNDWRFGLFANSGE